MHHHSILCWLYDFYINHAECGEADTTEVCHGCLFVTYLFIWHSLICPFSQSCHVYLIFWVLDSENMGLFKINVGVLTTCHTQYTWDRSIFIFLFNRTTLQVLVTYLTGALYVNPLWFYKHQHKSQVYCLWQVVKTLTIILNNPV